MNYRRVRNLVSKHRDVFLVVLTVAALSALSILSLIFWDQSIFEWQRHHLVRFEKPLLLRALLQLGKAWLLVWLLLCWALLANSRERALTGLLALLLVMFAVLPLKAVTHRPRPREMIENHAGLEDRSNVFRGWSFPSGDTASVFAVAAAIFPFFGWLGRSAAASLAACIGVFRIVAFAHYLSDVFAGAAVGIIVACLAYRIIVSRSLLRRNLADFLSPKVLWAAIIIIPLTTGIFDGMDVLFAFSIVYPPLVIGLYVLSARRRVPWSTPLQYLKGIINS